MRILLKLILVINLLIASNVQATSPSVSTYIPPQAFQYFGTIEKEQSLIMPSFAYPHYFAGLIEHESCISLTHKKCWNPASRLKTSREEGAGVAQITRTWNPDGTVRFDALSDLRKAHMQELKDLSWSNVYQRPDLQIRAMIIMTRSNYKALYMVTNPIERLAMADAAYNGGLGSVNKDRRYCGLREHCDPQKWFANVEFNSLKSRRPIYGTRSAFDINRHHVFDVLKNRMPKYKSHFVKEGS